MAKRPLPSPNEVSEKQKGYRELWTDVKRRMALASWEGKSSIALTKQEYMFLHMMGRIDVKVSVGGSISATINGYSIEKLRDEQ